MRTGKAGHSVCRKGLPLNTNISREEKKKIKTEGKTSKPCTLWEKSELISHVL